MRTTVKKMRALASFSGFALSSSFDKLYKLAGQIRDTQLLIKKEKQKEKEKRVMPSFETWLENHLIQLEEEWERLYKKAEIKKKAGKLEKGKPTVKHGSAEKFSKERGEALMVFRQQHSINDEHIHKGRKSVKEVDFVTRWLHKHKQIPHSIVSEETLKTISDDTGHFMDAVSAIKLLDEYIEVENDEELRSQALELKAKWTEQKEEEKRQLIERINSHKYLAI